MQGRVEFQASADAEFLNYYSVFDDCHLMCQLENTESPGTQLK